MPYLESARIEEAAAKAGNVAAYGSADARSGRLTEVDDLKLAAASVWTEAIAAKHCWIEFDVIRSLLNHDQDLLHALQAQEFATPRIVMNALLRDAVLKAYRLSDPANQDTLSLLRFAKVWSTNTGLICFTSEQWALDTGQMPEVSKTTALRNKQLIEDYLKVVPTKWGAHASTPEDTTFVKLREGLKGLRDRYLAHAVVDSVRDVDLSTAGSFIHRSAELASTARYVMTGYSGALSDFEQIHRESTELFWATAFAAIKAKLTSPRP